MQRKASFEVVDLTKATLTAAQIGELCKKLGVSPREILRSKEPAYAENDLGSAKLTDGKLLKLMAGSPGLIQRPIVVKGSKAVIARPVEAALDLLK